jgi:hypothetical protein
LRPKADGEGREIYTDKRMCSQEKTEDVTFHHHAWGDKNHGGKG